MNELRTTEERISTSMVSSTLESRSEKMMPVDTLTAVGAAARRADPAALNVLHLHLALDAESLRALTTYAMEWVESKRGNSMERGALHSACKTAIRLWALPTCHKCNGRKYRSIPGTPMLSNRNCPACSGSGMAKIGEKNQELIKIICSWLHTIESDIAYFVRKKMANC